MRRTLAALLRNTLGLRRLGRASRFLLNASRFDGDGDPHSNGEYRYLESVIPTALDRKGLCMVFDVGANVGSTTLADTLRQERMAAKRQMGNVLFGT